MTVVRSIVLHSLWRIVNSLVYYKGKFRTKTVEKCIVHQQLTWRHSPVWSDSSLVSSGWRGHRYALAQCNVATNLTWIGVSTALGAAMDRDTRRREDEEDVDTRELDESWDRRLIWTARRQVTWSVKDHTNLEHVVTMTSNNLKILQTVFHIVDTPTSKTIIIYTILLGRQTYVKCC